MTWEEKYRGFIYLIYFLLSNKIITLKDLKGYVEKISEAMGDSPEFKYADKRLKKEVVQIVQLLEN